MKLERITAESWVNAFSIMLLMNAAGAAITGAIYLLLGIFAPMSTLNEGVTKITTIIVGIFALVIAPFLYMWGRSMWERKPWSRTVLLVVASCSMLLAVMFVVLGISLFGMEQDAVRSRLMGALVIVVALLFAAYAAFVVWLFTQADVAAVFGRPQAFSWGTETMAAIVRGWALLLWVSAATAIAAAVLIALASPLLAGAFTEFAAAYEPKVTFGISIAVILLIALIVAIIGVVMHFVSKGMWGFRNWARVLLIVFAWASLAFATVGFIDSLFDYEDMTAVADALSNLIYGGGLAVLQIWFLREAKGLFVSAADAGRPAQKAIHKAIPKRTVKRRK